MKALPLPKLLSLFLGVLLISSIVNISTPTEMTNVDDTSLNRGPFRIAATYTPGDYPTGLNLSDGDVLDASGGGVYNVTGNFTILSGVTVTIAEGSKLVVYADNIIINGTLNGNSAGYDGGLGTRADGNPGNCIPSSGGGEGGDNGWVRYGMPNYYIAGGGGGGGAHGSNGEDGGKTSSYLMYGGVGGIEFGQEGFEGLIPSPTDISMGAGGGGGGAQASEYYEVDFSAGYGGDGGGAVYLEAIDTVLVNGIITCNGVSGHSGTTGYDDASGGGGGGGGAGGGILLFSEHVRVTGTLTTAEGGGGSGGTGNDGPNGYDGGDGSGGRIMIAYKTSLNTTGSTITEGTGGSIYTYQIDLVEPIFTLTGPANNTIHQSGIPVVVNISDTRGLQSVSYNWDGDANVTVTLSNSSYILTTPLPSSDGGHILEVFAQDDPGNWSYERYTFISDDSSPAIILAAPDNNTIHGSGSVIKFAVSDMISLNEVLYNWDGLGSNESLSYPYELLQPLGDGEHTLTLYASDTSGNYETKVYSFVTDDTNPSVSSPDDITYTVGSIGHHISWNLTDSNPSTYMIIVDNETLESDIWVSGMEVNTTVDGLSSGIYVYTIIAYDEANNLYMDTVVVTVEPIPSITTTTTGTTSGNTTTPTSPLFDTDTLTWMLASGLGGALIVGIIGLIISRKRSG